jgi:threonine dehydratase
MMKPTLQLPSPDDVLRARARISRLVVRTPLLRCEALDAHTGAEVWVKAEVLQHTGSFKIRGASNAIAQLSSAERARGVVAFSSGNHAQGVARAARLAGLQATIVMPSDAPMIKVERVREDGAEIIFYDRQRESREAIAGHLADARGAALIPSYDHADVIAGQGTLGLELVEQLDAPLDRLICCVGGGGLIAGCALAMEAVSPGTRVYGAEPDGHDDYARSLDQGVRVSNAPGMRTICDAIVTDKPGEMTFAINQPRLSGIGVVSDADIAAAMRFAYRVLKLVVEPGGAAALAAVMVGKADIQPGERIVIVTTGGNVDPALYARILNGADA